MKRKRSERLAQRLRAAGWGVVPPECHRVDMSAEFVEAWEKAQGMTMISAERGWALAEAVKYVIRRQIPGDIVECGVWKGGACLLASLFVHREEPDSRRRIWLYDTFTGMEDPGIQDKIAASGQPLTERDPKGWWAAGVDEVKKNLEQSPLPSSSFVFRPGRVEETLDADIPQQISILRLDTDWYESTKKELEILYPRLSPRGVLIIDDYGHFTGARQAVDEYFAARGEQVLLHRSDYTQRVVVK